MICPAKYGEIPSVKKGNSDGEIKETLLTKNTDASMMVYSPLETARANGLNPQKYLEYLLEARPNESMSDEQLEALSPWSPMVQDCCINKNE